MNELDWGREAARLRGWLVAWLGPGLTEVAEDAAGEALLRAVRIWRMHGPPDSPQAWLRTAARRAAIDDLRKRQRTVPLEPDRPVPASLPPEALEDDELRLLFLTCHPTLKAEDAVAMTLRTALGLRLPAIARAFGVSESAMEGRLVRARRRMAEVSLDLPADPQPRLARVLETLYAAGNEAYLPTEGESLVDDVLARRVSELATRLAFHRIGDVPPTHALVAILRFHLARRPARTDGEGRLIPLPEQDRTRWDARELAAAYRALDRSASGDRLTPYHVEAAILAVHAAEPVDWVAIRDWYETLVLLRPSHAVQIGQAVAMAHADGVEAGWAELERIGAVNDHRWYAARAWCLRQIGKDDTVDRMEAARRAPHLREKEFLVGLSS